MGREQDAAEALRHIALDESLKGYVLQHPPLYKTILRSAMRFIGGETLEGCLEVARKINQQGHAVTIDFMGESTRDEKMAAAATEEFLRVVSAIAQQNLQSSVSLDLSHIGMVIDPELGYQNAVAIAQAAQKAGLEMMISMEGTDRTTLILEIYQRLCQQVSNVGITLQAYLYRTGEDLNRVLQSPGKVRLVKGAYEAPSELAYDRGADLDAAYCRLMETLLTRGKACSIATHDQAILDHAHEVIERHAIDAQNVEFEMLKGVTYDRLQAMGERGYATRVYLPYGKEWHLYLCNRLAEYPPNLYQAIADAAIFS
ncbi:MAG: proline dehydrogenase family protein [Cyanobacteria bacterium J06614_10]